MDLEVEEPLDDPAYVAAREFSLNCSADPLPSREAIIARLRELEAWGVDLSLVQASLDLTPTQRLEQNADIVRFAHAARVGRRSRALR
ncbi:MAG TPA: hypothetical protein VK009_27140 [Chloroflexota bacterium]|nr:hypothetical protein [Chloroflexota bacterium]